MLSLFWSCFDQAVTTRGHRVSRGCSYSPWTGQRPKAAGWDKYSALFSRPTFVSAMPVPKGISGIAGNGLHPKHPPLITHTGLWWDYMWTAHSKAVVLQKIWSLISSKYLFSSDHRWPYDISLLLLFASTWSLRESFTSVGLNLTHFFSVSALGTYTNIAMTLSHVYKLHAVCLFIWIRR